MRELLSPDDSAADKVMLTEESIGKSIPQDWAADTGGSPSMTDQLYLFRERDLCLKSKYK